MLVGNSGNADALYEAKRFRVVVLELDADGSGGAVTDEAVDLSSIYNGFQPKYFFMLKDKFGAGAAAPDAHVITIKDGDADAILTSASIAATGWVDGAEDLPNYWPVTEDITVSVGDIGADNETTITLIFSP
jgi:hypothetical protein